MKKRLKIHVKGEYRSKEHKDRCLIKSFDTKIVLDVDSRNAIKYELKKDKRLYKHIRDNVDPFASSVREVHVVSCVSDVALDAGIDVDMLRTAGREVLEQFIKQEELRIDPNQFTTLTGLRGAILKLVAGDAEAQPRARLVEQIAGDVGDAQREVVVETIEEIEELDDRGLRIEQQAPSRGLPIEELPIDE